MYSIESLTGAWLKGYRNRTQRIARDIRWSGLDEARRISQYIKEASVDGDPGDYADMVLAGEDDAVLDAFGC